MGNMCLVVTPEIQNVTDKILQKYPEPCERTGFDAKMCTEWIGAYNSEMNKKPDFIPDYTALIHFVEKKRNMDGKSFLHIPEDITYALPGQKVQTYTVIGKKIFNRKGQEVFAEGVESLKTHRARVLANLAVKKGEAVVVDHKGHKYVVYKNNDILSVSSSKIMEWGEENGDRKEILRLSQIAFREKEKTETATFNLDTAKEGEENNHAQPNVEIFNGYWTRNQVAQQQDKVFLFGDNTNDRVSTHYVPSSTQAVIRGLPNAIGIDTKKNRGTSANSYFTDADFDLFKAQVDFAIAQAKAMGRTIVIPADGIGTGKAMSKEKAPKCFEYLQSELQKLQTPTINQKENRLNNKIEYGNEFRRVQETVRRSSQEVGKSVSGRNIPENRRQDLANVLRRELGSQHSFVHGSSRNVTNSKHGTSFVLHTEVDPQLFHDVFEVVRYYTPNGELVDLHDDYAGCKCFLTEDGTAGFAIEPDGNLVSVFNLGTTKGFLSAVKDVILESGATHLDAYQSKNQDLRFMYEKLLGAKTASSMDYNIEYDHDDIAKNHGEPKVIFMVIGKSAEKDVEEKHFTKDQYNEAVTYQKVVVQATIDETPIEDAWKDYETTSPAEGSKIEASLEEDKKPQEKPQEPKSEAYESALKTSDSRTAQFNRTFSPQQIKDRGAMIANIFSRILDDYYQDLINDQLDIIEDEAATEQQKNDAKEVLHNLKDPVIGRQYAAQEKGLEAILKEIKQQLKWDLEAASEEKKILWQNTIDYFEDLFNTQATLDIEGKEGIRILGLELKQAVSEDENNAQEDGNDDVGNIVSGNDGWNFKVRYTNPFNSLSRKVKGMLYEIERPEGEKDDLGQTRYYPMGRIYASLLSYLTANMQDSDAFLHVIKDFDSLPETFRGSWGEIKTQEDLDARYPNGYPEFPVLEKMSKVYPWVNQIIDRLTDDYLDSDSNTSLKYPSTGGSMASQFYTNFKQAYIPYAKIQIGNNSKTGKPYDNITPLNYQMEERVQRDKLEANYNNRMILTDLSVYNSDGSLNKEHAGVLKKKISEVITKLNQQDYSQYPELIEYQENNPNEKILTPEEIAEYNRLMDDTRKVLQSFGIDATDDSVMAYLMMGEGGSELLKMISDLSYIADRILKVDDSKTKDFNYMLDLRNPYGERVWEHFFDGRGLITDSSYMQSFYDSASKKTKYSYSADNYLMKTFRGVCMGTKGQRQAYINEHFGNFEWFRRQDMKEGTGWRNKWLEFWYNYDGEQKEIPYRNIDNVTEYTNNGAVVRHYSKWTHDDIWQVQDRSYNPNSGAKTAFYLAPIFSDSPMSMTVKGPRMSMEELLYGYNEGKDHYQGALVNLVNQELWRIQYVQQRAQAIKEDRLKPIANFDDKRGRQFCFLPELNNYVFENGESFLDRMIRLKNEKATMQEIEASQIQAIKAAIDSKMEEYGMENADHYTEQSIKTEQYYNMVYANAAIIQLTTVDLAFYKGDTDFQKRFKEVYAGGIQLNTNSKYGRKTENVILLSDDIITSPSYNEIAAIIDNSDTLTKDDKKDIKALFTDINVADAQAIRSMHSFRSILDMMGNWTDEMETALQHFKEGTWDRADFDIMYQTIKPFVYSVIERNDGNGGSILVPQQHKNSEICALMMYDLIANGLGSSPVYKALSRFMEDNLDADGNPIVDMAQFESAGKVGNQGTINISVNQSKIVDLLNGDFYDTKQDNEVAEIVDRLDLMPAYIKHDNGNAEFLPIDLEHAIDNYYGKAKYKGKKVREGLKEQLDNFLIKGNISQKEYDKVIAYLRPTEEEIISILEQSVLVTNPDGTKGINPEVVHTIPFDNYYQQQPTPPHHVDAERTNYGSQERNISVADLPDDFELSVRAKDGTYTFKGRNDIIDFYYELLNENLIEDFFGKDNKEGLKGIFASKENLRDAVTEIVRGNPKYGRDFAEALQVDDNGDFVLSPNSPTVFNLMQEIMTSFFKNRITKQTINGAALIQAAGIGLDKDLRMMFDKKGKLLGAECLMPLTSKKFFEPLLETKIINGKEEKVLDPRKLKEAGLDKAVGYRIPTENKSSMMPLIIKDFTPLQNGSAIVLPAEITTIAGSDFDVDKMYVMLLSSYIQEFDMRRAREDYAREDAVYKEILSKFTNSQLANDLLDIEPQSFKEWFEENKEEYRLDKPILRKIEYDFNKAPKENGRKARNNMLIQMVFGILTSKEGSESVLNPQGFKDFKKAAKINRILTDTQLRKQFIPEDTVDMKSAINTLLSMNTEQLEDFIGNNSVPESPIYPQTFTHSHARNMAGALQIGIYAIQGSMAAKYQRADVRLRQEQQFTLNGRVIANVDVSDGGSRMKNVGQMVGASTDNGKDPNLSDAGSTLKTAPIIGYMLRTGMSHLEAVLVMNQPYMKESQYTFEDTKGNKNYWTKTLGKFPLSSPVSVTTDMLIRNLVDPESLTDEENKAIAGLCYRVLMQHKSQEYLTQISRADSPNGAMQNSYAKARIQRYKVDLFNAKMGQDRFPFVRIKEAISNDSIDVTASEEVIREQLKGQRMAFLHGMYALGINSFNSLMSPYFFGANQWFDDRIVKPILYNLNEKLPDSAKERIVNGIYVSYITYMLSGSPLFGNEENRTMKQKRDYYLNTFPTDYLNIIKENKDIRELLGSILQVKNFGSRKRVILQDVGSLSKGQKQDAQRRLEGLLYMKDPEAAKIGKKLAVDLLVYSYFDNGLQFTPDSFSHLFTTQFITSFPTYTDTLRELEREITPEEEQNFIKQFLLTYPEAAYSVDGIINADDHVFDDGNTIRVNIVPVSPDGRKMDKYMVNQLMSPNPHAEGKNVYPYIRYNTDIFILDQNQYEQDPGNPVYHKIASYQTYPKLPLFNREMSVTEMAEEFPVYGAASDASYDGIADDFIAHDEAQEDPSLDSGSIYPEYEDIGSWFDAINSPEVTQAEESGPSEAFLSEGEGELKDPLC